MDVSSLPRPPSAQTREISTVESEQIRHHMAQEQKNKLTKNLTARENDKFEGGERGGGTACLTAKIQSRGIFFFENTGLFFFLAQSLRENAQQI